MKKILLTIFIFYTGFCFAQQNLPLRSFAPIQKPKPDTNFSFVLVLPDNASKNLPDAKKLSSMIAEKIVEEQQKQEVHHFTLYGIGKLDDETLQKLNGSGKLAIGFSPNTIEPGKKCWYQTNFFAAFNKNATNNDSLLASTLLFPEVGAQSLLLSAMPQWMKHKEDSLIRHFGVFGEFAFKQIKTGIDSLKGRPKELSINTLHWACGFQYGFVKSKIKDGKPMSMGVNAMALISYTNIPDEDDDNFKKIVGEVGSDDHFWSAGFKVTFEINGFQLFADMRHVFGSESSLPVKDLRGFNSNIGVTFSTDILSF